LSHPPLHLRSFSLAFRLRTWHGRLGQAWQGPMGRTGELTPGFGSSCAHRTLIIFASPSGWSIIACSANSVEPRCARLRYSRAAAVYPSKYGRGSNPGSRATSSFRCSAVKNASPTPGKPVAVLWCGDRWQKSASGTP